MSQIITIAISNSISKELENLSKTTNQSKSFHVKDSY